MRRTLAILPALVLLLLAGWHGFTPDPVAPDATATVPEPQAPPRLAVRAHGEVVPALDEAAQARTTRTGRVIDADGRPLPGAWLEFSRTRLRGIGQITADEDGRFVVPDDVGADHLVGCFHGGHYSHSGSWPAGEGAWTIRLRPKACIQGRVLDDRGEPVTFLWVRIEGEGRTRHVKPCGSGRWRMFLPGDAYAVRITSQAGFLAERTVRVADGEVVDWELTLPAARTLRPRVLPPAGHADATLGLRLFEAKAGTRELDADDGYLVNDWSTPTDREAAMTVPPDGALHWLVVYHEDHDDIPLLVHGPLRGAPQDVEVVVPADRLPTAFLVGRVPQDPDADEAETSRTAWLYDQHGFATEAHVDDDAGAFRLGPVPPGRYELRIVSYGDRVLHRRPVELTKGQQLDLGAMVR